MRSWSTNHWRTVFSLLVPALPEPREDGTGVEDDGGAAGGIEAGVHVLDPAPVGGRFPWEPGPGGEAVEFVIVVVGLRCTSLDSTWDWRRRDRKCGACRFLGCGTWGS